MEKRGRLTAALILALALLPVAAKADIVSFPISSDYDAEFARAADLLESGERGQGERALEQIPARSGQPAWKARVEMLLAAEDERRADWVSAIRHLAAAPCASIGLEPYRHLHLGRDWEALGRLADAQSELALAFGTDEPFAERASAGLALAGVLEKRGQAAQALAVLARAQSLSAGSGQSAAIGIERIRLGDKLHDPAAVRAAARDLISAGIDVAVPLAARRAIAAEVHRLPPADRARFARARIAQGDFITGVRLLKGDPPSAWPAAERAANLLALAQGLRRTGAAAAADRVAAGVPADGSDASFEARLLRADMALARENKLFIVSGNAESPGLAAVRRALLDLTQPSTPAAVRSQARERLIGIAAQRGLFEEGLDEARRLLAESGTTTAGFEPLWKLAWQSFFQTDTSQALSRLSDLESVYGGTFAERRLRYWTARCLERQGRPDQAAKIFQALASARPPDLYGLFARRRGGTSVSPSAPAVSEPTVAAAVYRKTDELLRLRFFPEAAAEASALPRSAGRDRRLAEAEFAIGRFPAAAAAVKRAFPEIGTANEGHVPDAWRRLFYPIEVGGFLPERAHEFGLDPALLRGLVRQESVFEAGARSKAGALGLTQLLPATAKSLSRSILRQRYRRAFLYDPNTNARLGAAYLKRLLDRFGGNAVYALAAYNGGPTRMARLLKENPSRPEDEVFESHPAYETRDYVRRVLLFAESYRELYP